MNRRTIAILIFILAVLVLSAVGVLFVLQQDAGPAPQGPASADIPPGAELLPGSATTPIPGLEPGQAMPDMVEVVVSLQTLPRGYRLTENELVTDLRLATDVHSNVITNIADAVGLYARKDIYQGETLTYDALVQDPTILGQNEYGPSSLIPPGFVAAAVPMNRLTSVGYGLDAGDSIDILLSFYIYRIDEQFQTYLENASQIVFLDEEGNEVIILISPYGRFEELENGDLAQVAPREFQRPVLVSLILQNAKVIQVGSWTPPEAVSGPTPTPIPAPEDATPTFVPLPPTATPIPEVLVVAMSPQQQLFLKYAIESKATISYALRPVQDGQLYSVQPVDLNYILQRFSIDLPVSIDFSVDSLIEIENNEITPTPPNPSPSGD